MTDEPSRQRKLAEALMTLLDREDERVECVYVANAVFDDLLGPEHHDAPRGGMRGVEVACWSGLVRVRTDRFLAREQVYLHFPNGRLELRTVQELRS